MDLQVPLALKVQVFLPGQDHHQVLLVLVDPVAQWVLLVRLAPEVQPARQVLGRRCPLLGL